MTTIDALAVIRKEVNSRRAYHRFAPNNACWEKDQTPEQVLEEVLRIIDRVAGAVIVEEKAVTTDRNFLRSAKNFILAKVSKEEFNAKSSQKGQ